MLGEEVFSLHLKAASDSVVQTARGLHSITWVIEKSLDARLHCTLKDSGFSEAMLEDQKKCGAEQGVT